MRLSQILENEEMKKIMVMPGGFHPFHAGHYALYKSIVEAYPDADVYVAATDAKTERPFPFDAKRKLATIAGVPTSRFIQVTSPFSADQYLPLTPDPNNTALIFVRSEKDMDQHPMPGDPNKLVSRGPRKGLPPYILAYDGNPKPMTEHAYITYMPTVDFQVGNTTVRSATELRAMWANATDEQKQLITMHLYPDASASKQKQAYEIIDGILG